MALRVNLLGEDPPPSCICSIHDLGLTPYEAISKHLWVVQEASLVVAMHCTVPFLL